MSLETAPCLALATSLMMATSLAPAAWADAPGAACGHQPLDDRAMGSLATGSGELAKVLRPARLHGTGVLQELLVETLNVSGVPAGERRGG